MNNLSRAARGSVGIKSSQPRLDRHHSISHHPWREFTAIPQLSKFSRGIRSGVFAFRRGGRRSPCPGPSRGTGCATRSGAAPSGNCGHASVGSRSRCSGSRSIAVRAANAPDLGMRRDAADSIVVTPVSVAASVGVVLDRLRRSRAPRPRRWRLRRFVSMTTASTVAPRARRPTIRVWAQRPTTRSPPELHGPRTRRRGWRSSSGSRSGTSERGSTAHSPTSAPRHSRRPREPDRIKMGIHGSCESPTSTSPPRT